MKFYLIWMALGAIGTTLANVLILPTMLDVSWGYVAIATPLNYAMIFGLDCVVALVVHKLPEKWFHPKRLLFRVSRAEQKVYEFFLIKKWKEKIPELGGTLAKFKKSKVVSMEPQYLKKFMSENCYASALHVCMSIFGFAIIFVNPIETWLFYPLQLAVFNLMLNTLPVMVQRYNRNKLVKLYELSERAAQRAARAGAPVTTAATVAVESGERTGTAKAAGAQSADAVGMPKAANIE